jgi:Fe-S cluster assembly protein SufD
MTGSLQQPTDAVFDRFEAMLPEALEHSTDPQAQRDALEKLRKTGFPHRKVEAWKYTDVSRIVERPYTRPHSGAFAMYIPPPVESNLITTLPAVGDGHPFALLCRALSHGGMEITIPPDTVVEELIDLDMPIARAGALFCPALVIRIGARSRADIQVRSHRQGEASLVSWIVDIEVGDEADLSVTKIRTGDGANFCNLNTRQAAGSRLSLFDATLGGELTRNDLHAVLEGEAADVVLNGLYLLDGRSHADNHTAVEHAVKNTRSRQLYKGLINQKACGVFNGRIVVNPGASGTDAYQMNRNLLQSRGARVDTKPQLEIANDDVRCSHGATIGRLDDAERFYLQTRGLDGDAADALLARGFAGDVIDRVTHPGVRKTLHELAEAFLTSAGKEPA